MRVLARKIIFLAAAIFALAGNCLASNITLSLNVEAKDDLIKLDITNTSLEAATGLKLWVRLNNQEYPVAIDDVLPAHERIQREVKVLLPYKPGSYPLYARLAYLNEGRELSLIQAGYFHNNGKSIVQVFCPDFTIRLRQRVQFKPGLQQSVAMNLFVPEEVRRSKLAEGEGWMLINSRPEFNITSPAYLILEDDAGDKHSTIICDGKLITRRVPGAYSHFRSKVILLIAFLSTLIAAAAYRRYENRQSGKWSIAIARAAFTVTGVSLLLLFSRYAAIIPEKLIEPLERLRLIFGNRLISIVKFELDALYFQSGDYDYFFRYVADWLYLYLLVLNVFVLRFVIRPNPVDDKNWHLMRWWFSYCSSGELFWSPLAKVGALAWVVKAFYVPLLCSWTVNNIFHQMNLYNSLAPTFYSINEFVVALFIFIDVIIFAVGYLVELPQLKNTIRTVEPTLFGWAICLICYPPFNHIAFATIDEPFANLSSVYVPGRRVGEVLITLLWAIYVWATIALCFKSSNLTNRGIVKDGPYRYIRHPAYVSKVALWLVTALFLGSMNPVMVVAMMLVYSLRAWTEERHLSMDPDYLEYKKEVPWVALPRII